MSFLYNIGIAFYTLLIRLAGLFNKKANLWVQGRRGWKDELKQAFSKEDKVIWFHAASLGEFEQGRPVIEAIRKNYPSYKILLTFFSPSGYEQKKDYQIADKVMYLPPDCKRNAKHFVKIINPAVAVFIKYEFWYNYLSALHLANIPCFFISALFRKEQPFFKWYGGWFRKKLKNITHFFVQDAASAEMLNTINIKHVTISGDTRFDRVADILENKAEHQDIAAFCEGHKVLLVGSSWSPDEEILAGIPEAFPDMKIIIAPHEVKEDRITEVAKTFKVSSARYTKDSTSTWNQHQLLIIDTVGVLSSIYRYADIAYIGGGFGSGLHNIQEPAVNGMPVFFGPKYHKFREAKALVDLGGAFTVNNARQLEAKLSELLHDDQFLIKTSEISRKYMLDNIGATNKILEGIDRFL